MDSNIKIKKGQIEAYAVPLAGTEAEKPISGDLQISSENKIFTQSDFNESGIRYLNDVVNTAVRLYAKNTNDETTEIEISNSNGIFVQDNRPLSKGIVGTTLFDKQKDPNAFAQLGDFIEVVGDFDLDAITANGNTTYNGINSLGVKSVFDGGGIETSLINAPSEGNIQINSSNTLSLAANNLQLLGSPVKINSKNAITEINGQQANDAGEITVSTESQGLQSVLENGSSASIPFNFNITVGQPEVSNSILSGSESSMLISTKNTEETYNSISTLSNKVDITGNSVEINSNDNSFIGATYTQDYSANFTDRSLVDKAFVMSVAGGIPLAGNIGNPVMGDLELTSGLQIFTKGLENSTSSIYFAPNGLYMGYAQDANIDSSYSSIQLNRDDITIDGFNSSAETTGYKGLVGANTFSNDYENHAQYVQNGAMFEYANVVNEYSGAEIKIAGRWAYNNQSIYRKVIIVNTGNVELASGWSNDIELLGIDKVIKIDVTYKTASGQFMSESSFLQERENEVTLARVYLQPSSGLLAQAISVNSSANPEDTDISNIDITIIIEYTKTTD